MNHLVPLVRGLTASLLFPVLLVALATAGTMDDARFTLHATAHHVSTSKTPACMSPYNPNIAEISCADYSTTAGVQESPGPDVYLVVGQGGSIGMSYVSCGVDYTPGGGPGNGVDQDLIEWTACTDGLEFRSSGPNGEWPAPGGGLRMTWLTCQDQQMPILGVHAVVGVFYTYAYSEDAFRVTPNEAVAEAPELLVSDCLINDTDLLEITDPNLWSLLTGRIHFGGDGSQGYTPCSTVATEPATWGRIKSQYGRKGEED